MAFFRHFVWLLARAARMTVRGLGYMFWVSGLFGAAILLLQGVAQLEGETIAKLPETPEGVRGRLKIVGVFLAAAFCGWLLYLATDVFWNGNFPDYRTRLLRALFKGFVCWAAAYLFLCLLVFAGSFQARWRVPSAYYWVAGGAGFGLLLLLAAAEIVHRRLHDAPAEAAARSGRTKGTA